MPKSYNKDALRGMPMDDKQWQEDMREVGVDIPDDLLYKPAGPRYAMKVIRDMNEQALMEREGLTKPEARKKAMPMYKAATEQYEKLLKA